MLAAARLGVLAVRLAPDPAARAEVDRLAVAPPELVRLAAAEPLELLRLAARLTELLRLAAWTHPSCCA